MKNTQLKGFSFVEILMIITILALISVVAYTSFGVRQNNAVNSKIQSEVISLGNALLLAKQENNTLPQPQGNRNFFAEDTSYVHDFEDSETFGVHGFITHNTLAKKYIDIVPVDPRTGSFYAYGKSKGTGSLDEMYEIAGIIWDGDTPNTFVSGDYTAENGPFNLIREYNGPNFVHNESTLHFPYNPLERILTAKIDSYTGSVSINGIETYTENQLLSYELKSGDTIEVKQSGVVELYYSDGSRSVLGDSSNDTILTLQKMDFIQDNNLITDIKLVLESGMIWNKAASLDDESGFEIYTTDSTAAVRGTIFGVQKNNDDSEVIVQKGTVAIKQNNISNAETIKSYINNEDTHNIPTTEITMIPGLIDIENTETVIKVENNESEKGASVGSTGGTSFSTGAIDDIPTIIKDTTVNNTPTINPNIKISLKEYYYSSSTDQISITLDIPRRVYKTADFLIINDNDVLLKENWGTSYTQSGRTISHIFDSSISPINSANFTESDIVSQSIKGMTTTAGSANPNQGGIDTSEGGINTSEGGVDTSEGGVNANEYNNRGELEIGKQTHGNQLLYTSNIFPGVSASIGSQDLVSYVNSKIYNGERDFTLQLAKRTLNGKIRVTNKIKFTIVDDKTYSNEEKEDNIIDEDEIKEESEEKLAQERGIEKGCNGFIFDNISSETELCATADIDLTLEGWNLVAYVPYNNAGDLNLYLSGGLKINNYWDNTGGKDNFITNVDCVTYPTVSQCSNTLGTFGSNNYIPSDSFVNYNSKTKGIYLDSDGQDDKVKYLLPSNLKNLNDYVIEINVKGSSLSRAGGPYYLYKNDSVKLYLYDNKLNLKDSNKSSNNLQHTIGDISIDPDLFYNVHIISNGNNYQFKINNFTEDMDFQEAQLRTTQYIGTSGYSNSWSNVINHIKYYSK